MNIDQWNARDSAALRAIYDAGQAWTWEQVQNRSTQAARQLRGWIEENPTPGQNPVLLPIHLADDGAGPYWLGVAFSAMQAEALREELGAFVGAAGTDFDGRAASLDPVLPLDRAVLDWAGGPWVYRFRALPNHRESVRTALSHMRRIWERRPALRSATYRHPEALLREYFSALAVPDEAAADRWLEELRASGGFSFDNIAFLEIEFFATFDHWDRIAFHPRLSILLEIRRPRRVTARLIEALWRTELAEYAAANDPAGAIRHTRESFLPRYANLLRARGSLEQPAVVLAFLLAAVAADPPRREQLPVLLAALPTTAPERGFAERVAASVAPPPPAAPPPLLTLVRAAIDNDDYDTAWLHLKAAPPTAAACAMRLTCAMELLDPEVARETYEAVTALPPDEREKLLRSKQQILLWEEVQKQLATPAHLAPSDWESWLDAVDSDPNWSEALPILYDAAEQWPRAAYENDPARGQALLGRIQTARAPEAAQRVRLALPHLIRFFLPEGEGRAVFLPLYSGLLLSLILDDRFGAEDWALSRTLATVILELGPSTDEYKLMAEAVADLWRQRGGIARLGWALDLLDAFAVAPPLALRERDEFYTAVWNTFHEHTRRVQLQDREWFRLLSGDLGHQAKYDALPTAPPQGTVPEAFNFSVHLDSKVIALYTLEETVGQRTRNLLKSLCATVDVRLSHDHVGSERLRSLAREADFFVVANRSAKHAATDFIKQERPAWRSEIVYASGKGSSSLLAAVCDAAKRAD